ncbi:Sodium/calcium exchanger 1 [Folsomia candida]|uniref:Sodium/calcium exchanger 1 n=1 Tax=Folsomia candida TaxID=158441 RepID=A0A226F0J5_FOLCA|nr:Sodium/calcium exchanger 1 [Folsomia candida]
MFSGTTSFYHRDDHYNGEKNTSLCVFSGLETIVNRTSAIKDPHADSTLGQLHWNNGVTIFFGLGSAWMTGALYHEFFSYASCESCSKFYIDPGSLTFETVILACVSLMAIVLLFVRRCTLGGELGGQTFSKYTTSVVLVFMWLVYFFLVSLEAYGLVPGF